jgi:hypothetical protein
MSQTNIHKKPMAVEEIIQTAQGALAGNIGLEAFVYLKSTRHAIRSDDEVYQAVFLKISAIVKTPVEHELGKTIVQGFDGDGKEIGYTIAELHSAFPLTIKKNEPAAA